MPLPGGISKHSSGLGCRLSQVFSPGSFFRALGHQDHFKRPLTASHLQLLPRVVNGGSSWPQLLQKKSISRNQTQEVGTGVVPPPPEKNFQRILCSSFHGNMCLLSVMLRGARVSLTATITGLSGWVQLGASLVLWPLALTNLKSSYRQNLPLSPSSI